MPKILNAKDTENLTKAAQCAVLLSDDLRELISADNPLLAEFAMDLIADAVEIEKKLRRLQAITE